MKLASVVLLVIIVFLQYIAQQKTKNWRQQNLDWTGLDHRPENGLDHRVDNRLDHRANNGSDHRPDNELDHGSNHGEDHGLDHGSDQRSDHGKKIQNSKFKIQNFAEQMYRANYTRVTTATVDFFLNLCVFLR